MSAELTMYKHLIFYEESNNTIIPNCDQGMKALAVTSVESSIGGGSNGAVERPARLKACHLFPVTVINQAKLFTVRLVNH